MRSNGSDIDSRSVVGSRPTIFRVIQKWPVISYFILTFALSWAAAALVVGPGGFPLTWDRFERLGPALYAAILLGPSGASVALTWVLEGREGLRALLGRLRKGRGGAWVYAIALLPAAVMTTAFLILSWASPAFGPAPVTADDKWATMLLGAGVSLLFGFFEELGWSGFAVPRLRASHGAVATAIIVGVAWGAWHFPLFWEADSFKAPLPFAILVTRLFSWLPGFRLLMVWLYDRSASLVVPMLMHASLVATQLFFLPRANAGAPLLLQLLVLPAMVWAIVVAFAVVRHASGRT